MDWEVDWGDGDDEGYLQDIVPRPDMMAENAVRCTRSPAKAEAPAKAQDDTVTLPEEVTASGTTSGDVEMTVEVSSSSAQLAAEATGPVSVGLTPVLSSRLGAVPVTAVEGQDMTVDVSTEAVQLADQATQQTQSLSGLCRSLLSGLQQCGMHFLWF